MGDLFASPRLAILRAQHHIDDLNSKINEFVSNKPWSYAIEQDLNARQDLHKIKFARRLPADLPCILFDAANNLRATLDQAGYASAIAGGETNPKRTNFPFGDDLAGLNNNIEGRKVCEHCPPEITTLFRAFKPYKGGNDALWALNKLCNTKKHFALVPFDIGRASLSIMQASEPVRSIEPGFMKITIKGTISGFASGMSVRNPDWDPDKYEITLARTPIGGNPNYKAHVALNIAIDGIENLGGKPAVGVLRNMVRVVESVLGATEAECRRMGLIK